MIVTGGPRKHKGRVGRLQQFCNDWFSVVLLPDADHPKTEAVILSPSQVRLTAAEAQHIRDARDRAGTLWTEFALRGPDGPDQGYHFSRIARPTTRRMGRHRPGESA